MPDDAAPDPAPPAVEQRSGVVARVAGLSPSGRARVPAAWALYDFANTIFSYAVVSTAIGLWLTEPQQLRPGPGPARPDDLHRRLGRHQRARLAARSARSATAADGGCPFLLFFTVLTIVPAAVIGVSAAVIGAHPVHDRQLRLPGRADLLRRDAVDRHVPGDARQAVGHRRRRRLHGHDRHRPAPDRARPAGRRRIFPISMALFAVFAVPIFLYVRERGTGAPAFTWADVAGLVHPDRPDDRPRPRGAGARRASSSAGSSTPTRSTRSSS